MKRISTLITSLALLLIVGCSNSSGPGGSGGRQGSVDVNGDDVNLEGFIESKQSESAMTVFGWTVLVDDNTEIEGETGDNLAFEDLVVGTWVHVQGKLTGSETVLAEEIEVETRDDDDDDGDDSSGENGDDGQP